MSIETIKGKFYLVCNLCGYSPEDKYTNVIPFNIFEEALAYKKCKEHHWKCKNLGLKDWIDMCPKCGGWA